MMFTKLANAFTAALLLCMLVLPAVPAAAHEAVEINDDLIDASKLEAHSEHWTIDGTNPSMFNGDAARIVRTATSEEYIVYKLTDIQSFSVNAYYFSGSTGVITFFGSADGAAWTEIPSQYADPVGTGSGWYGTVYTPAGALPAGINYLKIVISGDLDTWLMQLGSVLLSNVSNAPQSINDELSDVSKLASYTTNWAFDNSNPVYFGGDASRIVRTDVTAESIVYHLHNIRNFSARLHSFAGSTGVITFYSSPDGMNWTAIAAVHDTPVSTGDGAWTGTTYIPSSTLPSGVNYLKVELSGDAASWLMQLGSVILSNSISPGGGSGGTGGEGDYYVDAVTGSDSNDGKSESSAWKTFANVNSTVFAAGDRILLKKGGVWNEQLYPKGSGSLEEPITISSYGSGGKPIINGGGMAGAAVYLRNSSNWIIQNLEVTNSAAERGTIYREGIMVENANGGTVSNIQIRNNYVHNVSSSFRYPTGSGAEGGPHAFGGISVYTGGTTGTDKFDNVLIEGNTVERIGRTGIVVWDQRWNGDGFPSTNVIIRQNYVKQADSDGILTFGVDGALIEHNVAEEGGNYSEVGQFNGSAAIWPTRGKNNIVQFNESFNTNKPEGDGQGFNLDIDSTDSIVQYNYSHGNKGGFMLFVDARLTPGVLTGSSNSIVRYNISQNDLTHTFNFAGGVTPGTQIYNNTIYIGTGQNTKIIDHEWNEAGDLNAPYSFKNNIVYNLGTGGYSLPGVNGVFEHNLFYGNHPLTEPDDPYAITDNPMLVYQGGGTTGWDSVNGYKLREGSLALGAGTVIANNGGLDYWGDPVSSSSAPNIGAYNGAGLDESTLPEAPVDDLRLYFQGLKVVPHTANDSSGSKSLQLQFDNSLGESDLVINRVAWSVADGAGALSGVDTNVAPVASAAKSNYSIPLAGLSEGVQYPLELTVELEGYEKIELEKEIGFNRILQQKDSRDPVTIDLADGNAVLTGYSGTDDLSGTVKLRWDSEHLYLNADIKDDIVQHAASEGSIWQNDSIQFSVAPGVPGESQSWYEYGISDTPDGPQIYRWLAMQGAATGTVTSGTLSVTRDETAKITSYRLALPWSELGPIQPGANETISFSMLVNDNDGAGRKGYMEWGSGIGAAKDPALFRAFQLMELGSGGSTTSSGGSGGTVSSSHTIGKGVIAVQGYGWNNGIAQIDISSDEVVKALEDVSGGALLINVSSNNDIARGAAVHIPVQAFQGMQGSSKAPTVLIIKANGAEIAIPIKLLLSQIKSDSKQLVITVAETDRSVLPAELRQKWQNDAVYDFSIKIDGVSIDGVDGEDVQLSIPYELKQGEAAHQATVSSIQEDGSEKVVIKGRYNAGAKQLVFKPEQLGRYRGGYAGVHFADVTDWSQAAVETLAARGIVQGTGEGRFEPGRSITRAEFVKLIMSVLGGADKGEASAFTDVSADDWYSDAVGAAKRLGIVQGRKDGSFGGTETITREEMAVMAYRAIRLEATKKMVSSQSEHFNDAAQIGSYAREAVDALQQSGIMQGYKDGSYRPRMQSTRAEAATVVYRMLGI